MQQPKLRFKEYQNDQLISLEFKDLMEPGTNGIKRGPFGGALKKEIFVEDGFAVYEQQHAIYKDFEHIRYFINEDKYNELISFKIEAGDLIMSCSGTIGKIAVFPDDARPGVINQALIRFRTDRNRVNSEFLFHLLNSEYMQKKMLSINPGSAIKNLIAVPELKKIKINLFNIHEQKKIASFLTLLSKKIEKQLEKLDELEQYKKGMMQKIFSQELRFKDEDGGEFPKWEYATFGEVVTNKSEKHNPKSETITLPCIELENIKSERGQLIGNINNNDQKSMKNKFDRDSVLFGKLRPYLKKYWYANFDGLCSTEIWILNSKDSRLINGFIYFFIQGADFLDAANKSTGSKMPRADWDSVSELQFYIPAEKEQKKIVGYLTTLENKIVKEQEKLSVLQEQKRGFLQGMFV